MNNLSTIVKCLTPIEEAEEILTTLQDEAISDSHAVMERLEAHDLMLTLDWKGEEFDGQLFDFIEERLNKYEQDFELDDFSLRDELNLIHESKPFQAGEYFLRLLDAYKKQLSKQGFVLALLELHSDAYCLCVVNKDQLTKLKSIQFSDESYFTEQADCCIS